MRGEWGHSVLAKTEKCEVRAVFVLPAFCPDKRYPVGIGGVFADYRILVFSTVESILSKARERPTGMENTFKDCIVGLSLGQNFHWMRGEWVRIAE